VTKCGSPSQRVRLLITANAIPNSLILSTILKLATRSSETSVRTRITGRHIKKYGIRDNVHIFQMREFRCHHSDQQTNKQTPWPLVRERTIPTNRPPLLDEI
jgi:hypothetical protein